MHFEIAIAATLGLGSNCLKINTDIHVPDKRLFCLFFSVLGEIRTKFMLLLRSYRILAIICLKRYTPASTTS